MKRLGLLVALSCTLAVTAAAQAAPSATPDQDWGVNGEVHAVAAAGTHIFLGGAFSYVGPNTGNGIALDPTTGAPRHSSAYQYPAILGEVRAVLSDGVGGWYIGGDFYRVGGHSISRLAHIEPNGTLDTSFNPPTPDNTVNSITYASGGTLYIGGRFDQMGTTAREHLAAVSPTTGTLQSWNPGTNGDVAVVLHNPDNNGIYIGGNFSQLDGVASSGLGEVGTDGTDGGLHPVLTQNGNRGYVNDLATFGLPGSNSRLYVVGNFDSVDGNARGYGAAFAADGTNTLEPWDPMDTFTVDHVATDNTHVFTIGGGGVGPVNSLDPTTGDTVSGFSDVNAGDAIALALQGGTLYVSHTDGGAHRGIVALDPDTGAVQPNFNVEAGDVSCADCGIQAIGTSTGDIFVGGGFHSIGGAERRNLVALDATTGALDPNFAPSGWPDYVTALASAGSRLLIGEDGPLSAVDTTTGATDPNYSVSLDGTVKAIAVNGATAYLGGDFTGSLKAVSTTSPTAIAGFSPPAFDNQVDALAVTGSSLYAGGRFTGHLKALDPSTGAVQPAFTAAPDGEVDALLPANNHLYAGGQFQNINSVTQQGLAALDPTSGALVSGFNAHLDGNVSSLAASGSNLYVGGDGFDHAGSTAHSSLATLSANTGAALTGPADIRTDGDGADGTADQMILSAGRLILGGDFAEAAGAFRFNDAVFSDPTPQNLTPPSIGGTPRAGGTAGCSPGAWTSSPTSYTYQWLLDGAPISGATTSSYSPVGADVGHSLVCQVVAKSGSYTSSATNSPSVTVTSAVPANTTAPSIPSDIRVGDTVTCQPGSWTGSPSSYHYSWTRDSASIGGALSATYAATAADQGHALTCDVQAINGAGGSALAMSNSTTVGPQLLPAPVNTAKPSITGYNDSLADSPAYVPPRSISCNPGSWNYADPSAYEYAWYQGATKIGGATANTLSLSTNQQFYGATFTCEVTANGTGGATTLKSDSVSIFGSCGVDTTKPIVSRKGAGFGTIDRCAQGPGLGAVSQADPINTTLPLACNTTGGFGDLLVKGCFSTDGKQQIFKGNLQMNGIDIHPVLSSTTVTFDHQAFTQSEGGGSTGHDHYLGKVTSGDGDVEVYAGPVLVYKGKLNWDIPDDAGQQTSEIASFDPPQDANVEGFPILPGKEGQDPGKGEGITLSVAPDNTAQLKMNLDLPFNLGDVAKEILGIDDLSAAATLKTDPVNGLNSDSIQVEKDNVILGPVHIDKLVVSYDELMDEWTAEVKVDLPVSGVTLDGTLEFQHGSFKGVAIDLDGIHVLVFPLVFLTEINGKFEVNPTMIGAGAHFAIGDEVDGVSPASVDANLAFTWPDGATPAHFHADGSLALFDVPLESGYFDAYVGGALPPLFDFGFSMGIGLPDFHSDDPEGQPLYIGGGVDGWIQWPKFNVVGHVDVDFNFLPFSPSAGVEAVASSQAIAVCAHFAFVGGGAAYTWSTHDLDFMGPGCDIGPYEVPRPPGYTSSAARARGAAALPAGAKQVVLGSGSQVLKLHGTTGAPATVLTGPSGQHYTVDVHKVTETSAFVALPDQRDKLTVIGLRHAAGTWTIAPEPGTPALASIQAAKLLPDPKAKATVTGTGSRRRLHWTFNPGEAGDHLQITEKLGKDSHLLVDTTKSQGSIVFTPSPKGGRRALMASVVNASGTPRASGIKIGSYTAPKLPLVAAVRSLQVTAKGTTVTVRWRRVAGASYYGVLITGAHGLRAGRYVFRGTSTTFPNIVLGRRRTAKVSIVAAARTGASSTVLSRTIGLPAKPKPKPKPKPKHRR